MRRLCDVEVRTVSRPVDAGVALWAGEQGCIQRLPGLVAAGVTLWFGVPSRVQGRPQQGRHPRVGPVDFGGLWVRGRDVRPRLLNDRRRESG